MSYEFKDSNGQTYEEANRARQGAKPVSRYKGPVNTRKYSELENEVEREAFRMEAMESAQAIARQFGRKYSFMEMVAVCLSQIAIDNQ